MTSLRTSTNGLHPHRQGVDPLGTPDTPDLSTNNQKLLHFDKPRVVNIDTVPFLYEYT